VLRGEVASPLQCENFRRGQSGDDFVVTHRINLGIPRPPNYQYSSSRKSSMGFLEQITCLNRFVLSTGNGGYRMPVWIFLHAEKRKLHQILRQNLAKIDKAGEHREMRHRLRRCGCRMTRFSAYCDFGGKCVVPLRIEHAKQTS
jgi:hypothetical protein